MGQGPPLELGTEEDVGQLGVAVRPLSAIALRRVAVEHVGATAVMGQG